MLAGLAAGQMPDRLPKTCEFNKFLTEDIFLLHFHQALADIMSSASQKNRKGLWGVYGCKSD
jgi:hypothetical protein